MSWQLADTVASIPACFEAQVAARPSAPAIAGTAWQPTYAELDAASNRLAAALLDAGVAGGERVALLMRHDAPLMAAQLAVLKAGAIVVVLNPGDPPSRLARLREDTAPTLVLADDPQRERALAAGFADSSMLVVDERPDASPHEAPVIAIAADDLAVLMCTSGSTGSPVAVAQSHRNVLHNVLRHSNGLGLRADDRIVLLASPSGGQGAGTVWTTLLNGAALCPFPVHECGMNGLAEWLRETGVTVLIASASLFRRFLSVLDDAGLPAIRLVRLGSERALASDHEAWRARFPAHCAFANTYSSSETGAITQHIIGREAKLRRGPLPAGRPAQGIEVLLRAPDGSEPAPGEMGEIFVRSRHLSPGYWGEAELTAQRFAGAGAGEGDGDGEGAALFRTGDLGYRDADGLLTVLGRVDDLVKIRGNRVSLAEVETALGGLAGVGGAAVLADDSKEGETRLVAYVSPTVERVPSTAELRGALRERLPDHAVPVRFVLLDELPLTPHGKLDRAGLRRMRSPERVLADSAAPEERPRAMPTGETEELIAALWARVLGREGFGREQDFFEIGGDSLAAAEVAVGMGSALGIQVGMGAYACQPTIAGLAGLVARLRATASGGPDPPLCGSPPGEPQPASFAQERIWRHCQVPEEARRWVLAAAAAIRGDLDGDALRRSYDHLIRRHPALRTTFAERDGRLLQVIEPARATEMRLLDVSGDPDPPARAAAILRELARALFDLERGPLLRLALVRLGKREHQLLRVVHHITCDGPSWSMFMNELAQVYGALSGGEPPPLEDELPLSYGDVAAWQRERMRSGGPRHSRLLARWREVRAERATAPPFRRPAPVSGVHPREGVIHWGLQPAVTDGLAELAREAGATYYMVRMALYAALLAAETGERELIFGTYVTTRRQSETLGMFGCFTQLAAVRLTVPGEVTVGGWLALVRAEVLDVNDHADLPYETLMEELAREGKSPPGIETVFALKEARPPLRFAGLELGPPTHTMEHYMPSGFCFFVDRLREQDECRTDFDANVYDPTRVAAFIGRYRRLAAELCGDRDRPLWELVERSGEG